MEVALKKFNSTQSPVVYDVTVNTLDSTALTTDLGVTITGNQSSLNVGETVKLTVTAFNNGPNGASVKVNYVTVKKLGRMSIKRLFLVLNFCYNLYLQHNTCFNFH